MIARVLDAAEWPRLQETGLNWALWRTLDPETMQVVVVEKDGAILACWATMACRHVEGFWVHPDHRRRAGVVRRLAWTMRGLLHGLGATQVLTFAETPDVEALLLGAGATALPWKGFALPADFGPWRGKDTPCR